MPVLIASMLNILILMLLGIMIAAVYAHYWPVVIYSFVIATVCAMLEIILLIDWRNNL
ncbi:MAG: hypothetical protein QXF82_00875 [Nitrososphaeria archaeon]